MNLFAVNVPRLENPACSGRWELFDATVPETTGPTPDDVVYARAAALEICRSCPELDPCRAWLNTLPGTRKPAGVVAGLIVQSRRNRTTPAA